MTSNALSPTDLLRRLGSGVQSVGAAPASAATSRPESASFGELLRQAREGGAEASRPLKIGREVSDRFSDETLATLALAADAAEASGASRLAAIVEGKTVTIDVVAREIVATGDSAPGALITDADAFVVIPDERGAGTREDRAPSLGFPSSMPTNATLADTLARLVGDIARRVG